MSAAAIRAARAFVELSVEKAILKRDLRIVRGLVSGALDEIGKAGAKLTILGAGGAASFLPFIKSASDAQETLNRFTQVFGDQARAADKFATDLAGKTGRAVSGIRDSLASFNAFFKGLGFDDAAARSMSETLSELAIDFASFNNMSDDEAVGRFISAMSGSSEVLDRFGINLKQAAIEQQLLANGLGKSAAEASEAEKALARLDIITGTMGRTGATGDAVRTADQFANALRSVTSQAGRISRAVGAALLPALESVLPSIRDVLAGFAGFIERNPRLAQVLAGTALGVTALGTALVGLAVVGKTALFVVSAFTGLSLAMKVMTLASGGGPAVAAFFGGLVGTLKNVGAGLAAMAGRMVTVAGLLKTTAVVGLRVATVLGKLSAVGALAYGVFLLADAFGVMGKQAASAAEQLEQLQAVQQAGKDIAAANLIERSNNPQKAARRLADLDEIIATRKRIIAELAEQQRAGGGAGSFLQDPTGIGQKEEAASIAAALSDHQAALAGLVDEREKLRQVMAEAAKGPEGNPEEFESRRAELLDDQAVALGRITEAQRQYNALIRDGYNDQQARALTVLNEQLRAIEQQAQAQSRLQDFQAQRVELLEREAVLSGQMTEQQARFNQLVRQGLTQQQAAELAGIEARIAGLQDKPMAAQVQSQARGGDRASGSGLGRQAFFEFPKAAQDIARRQLEEQRKARELLQQISDANQSFGSVPTMNI